MNDDTIGLTSPVSKHGWSPSADSNSFQQSTTLLDLPTELKFYIFSLCNLRDVPSLKRISKQLQESTNDLTLIITLFAKNFFAFKVNVTEKLSEKNYKFRAININGRCFILLDEVR